MHLGGQLLGRVLLNWPFCWHMNPAYLAERKKWTLQTSKYTSEASDPFYTALLGRNARKLCMKLIQYLQTERDVEHLGRAMPIAEDPYDRPSSFTDKKVC